MKKFLHVGCGSKTKKQIKGFATDEWKEIRFDIDNKVNPDIEGSLTDMHLVASESMDAIFSSHNIEHIFPHEVPIALREFYRVLKSDGIVIITCPDLQSVCEAVVQDRLLDPLYESPAGPISPIDILYGHRGFVANGNIYMAHKCGFTYSSLKLAFLNAGYETILGRRRPKSFDLWLAASKTKRTEVEMKEIAFTFLP